MLFVPTVHVCMYNLSHEFVLFKKKKKRKQTRKKLSSLDNTTILLLNDITECFII